MSAAATSKQRSSLTGSDDAFVVTEGPRVDDVLTAEAIEFLSVLAREFAGAREELLAARHARALALRAGELPNFLPQSAAIRAGDWRVPPAPADLADRRVEITGPTERKMVINALNSGARMFMADFEDSNSPTWQNMLDGQRNLTDAIARTIRLETPEKTYELNDRVATLLVRPRGWHLVERHLEVDGRPISASLFDFGLYLLRNHEALAELGSGPYLYLPKLESHTEARLWNQVFERAQDLLGIPRGTVRATVLIETILAAFEMDEILYELGEHATGLNAGRWDYLFSVIKKLGHRPEFVLADRNTIGMGAPFMRAYAELLVATCHRRGAHAIGGMAAFIPSRRDAEVNRVALARVREDKQREASQGYDGTWVAHPDLVPVAMEIFDGVLGDKPNQLDSLREDVVPSAAALLDVAAQKGEITLDGLRNDVSVGIQYLAAWLDGNGAVAIFNLMEDAATSEIARAQVWQWLRHCKFTPAEVARVTDEELAKLTENPPSPGLDYQRARRLFDQVATGEEFVEFLTLPAYDELG
jgi:malate synthase